MKAKGLSRREFIRLSALTAAGAAVAACQPQTVVVKETVEVEKEVTTVVEKEVTTVVEKEVEKEVTKVVEKEVTKIVEKEKVVEVEKVVTPTPAPMEYKESPLLTSRVKLGQLPPVEERSPLAPLVIEPYEEIGQYGGTYHVGTIYTGYYRSDEHMLCARQPATILRMTPDLRGVVPNVAKDWEVSEDYKTITLELRKDVKWSDGEPFTADDLVHWYEDYFLNEDLTPAVPDGLDPGGEPLKLEKIDDYSFRFTFAAPAATFLLSSLGHEIGFWGLLRYPAHYLQEFHIKYNPQADELAKKEGLERWYQLYSYKRNHRSNMDLPSLSPFVITGETPAAVFLERSPYFWAVDTEGNQLPYVDKMICERVTNLEMYNARIVAGEYDFAGFNTAFQDYPAYVDGAKAGNYRIVLWKSGHGSDVVYNVNMNIEDPVLRELHQDKRYRQALSLAINRDEINKVIFYGQGLPGQLTVHPISQFFREEYLRAFAEYDPEKANALLDEMGLEWDDAHEVRLRPDGQPMKIAFDYFPAEVPEKTPITELVADYWKAIGLQIMPQQVTRELLRPRVQGNEEPMSLWHGDECCDSVFLARSKWFAPKPGGDENCWAILWARWWQTKGELGEEPPQEIKQLYEWGDRYLETGDAEWAHKVLQSQAENVWTIGTVGSIPRPLIVRNTLRNFPEDGLWCMDSMKLSTHYPEQFFFKR